MQSAHEILLDLEVTRRLEKARHDRWQDFVRRSKARYWHHVLGVVAWPMIVVAPGFLVDAWRFQPVHGLAGVFFLHSIGMLVGTLRGRETALREALVENSDELNRLLDLSGGRTCAPVTTPEGTIDRTGRSRSEAQNHSKGGAAPSPGVG